MAQKVVGSIPIVRPKLKPSVLLGVLIWLIHSGIEATPGRGHKQPVAVYVFVAWPNRKSICGLHIDRNSHRSPQSYISGHLMVSFSLPASQDLFTGIIDI